MNPGAGKRSVQAASAGECYRDAYSVAGVLGVCAHVLRNEVELVPTRV